MDNKAKAQQQQNKHQNPSQIQESNPEPPATQSGALPLDH